MKPICVKRGPLDIIKETPEDRLDRIKHSDMRTRVVKPKKGRGSYSRQKFKRG